MKALLTCPTCGYQVIGAAGSSPEDSLKAAIAGLQLHQDSAHGVPMTPDRFITQLRMGKAH